jgi:tetratricopeptide (TPR) repeat protein
MTDPAAIQRLSSFLEQGRSLFAQGRDREAEHISRGVMAECTRLLGPAHAQTIVATCNIGVCLVNLRHAEAEPLFRTAAQQSMQLYGQFYSMSVKTAHALGKCLLAQDRFHEAEPFLLRALEGMQGQESVDRMTVEYRVGLCYSQQRHAEALPYLQHAAEGLARGTDPLATVALDLFQACSALAGS